MSTRSVHVDTIGHPIASIRFPQTTDKRSESRSARDCGRETFATDARRGCAKSGMSYSRDHVLEGVSECFVNFGC